MDRRDREIRASHIRTPTGEVVAALRRMQAALRAYRDKRITREELESTRRVAEALSLAEEEDARVGQAGEPEQRSASSSALAEVLPLATRRLPTEPRIEGMIPYGRVADLGAFDEVLLPGAFARAAREDDVILTVGHDLGGQWMLARTRTGTLRLTDTAEGLRFVADLPSSAWGEHVAQLVGRGDFGVSFGFLGVRDRWRNDRVRPLREVLEVRTLVDVSLVGFPAYRDATAKTATRDGRRFLGSASLTPRTSPRAVPLGLARKRLELARQRMVLSERELPSLRE